MDLHTEITVSSKVPFWLSQARKGVKASVYNLDKSLHICGQAAKDESQILLYATTTQS
jgi:hypothetical protein